MENWVFNFGLCQLGMYSLQVIENSRLMGFKQMTVYSSKITVSPSGQLLVGVQLLSIVTTTYRGFLYDSLKFYSWSEMFHFMLTFEAARREI